MNHVNLACEICAFVERLSLEKFCIILQISNNITRITVQIKKKYNLLIHWMYRLPTHTLV